MGSAFSSCVKKASQEAIVSLEEAIIAKVLPLIEKKIEESLAQAAVKVSEVVTEFTSEQQTDSCS